MYASNLEEAKPTYYLLMHFDLAVSNASMVPCSGLDTAHSGALEPTLSKKGLHNKYATVSAQPAMYTHAAQQPACANTKLTDITSGRHMRNRRCPCTRRAEHCSVTSKILTSCTRCVQPHASTWVSDTPASANVFLMLHAYANQRTTRANTRLTK